MKRILFSLLTLAAVLSVAGAGSLAYFSDTETSSGNTFQVGTWDLASDSGTFTIENVNANDTGSYTFTATNTGTVSAYLDLNIVLAPTGDLVNHLTAHLYIGGGDVYAGAMSSIAGVYNLNLVLGAGASVSFNLDWVVDGTYTQMPGDKVTITINYDLKPQP